MIALEEYTEKENVIYVELTIHTYLDQKGIRHKNLHICNICYHRRSKVEDSSSKSGETLEIIDKSEMLYVIEGRSCYNCGYDKTYIYKNKPVWYKYYDDDGNVINNAYLCDKCYRLFQILRAEVDDKSFDSTVCNVCGGNKTYIKKNGKFAWYNDVNDEGMIITGKKICSYCKQKIYREMPCSHNNIIKLLRNWRTGNINILNSEGKGFITECVIVRIIGANNVNIEMDNFSWPYDLIHEKYKRINVKGRSPYYNMWIYDTQGKDVCDTYFLMGFDKDRKNIESACIIPNEEWIKDLVKMTIVRNPSRVSKYDQFKIDPKPYNDAYHSLMEFLKDKKYFGIEDIKKWLNECKFMKDI